LEALYGDPLRAETMRAARHLVIVSAITIAVVLFKVRVQPTSLVPLDLGERADALPMLLSVAVLLLFLNFITRATTDLLRDLETNVLVTRYIEDERVNAAKKASSAVDDDLERQQHEDQYGSSEPDPWWKDYYEIKEQSDEAVSKAEERLGIRRWPRGLRRWRKYAEIGVPSACAVSALILTAGHLTAFVSNLAAALWAVVTLSPAPST
jgi:hypothetical protein